jgi:hypothetical protein
MDYAEAWTRALTPLPGSTFLSGDRCTSWCGSCDDDGHMTLVASFERSGCFLGSSKIFSSNCRHQKQLMASPDAKALDAYFRICQTLASHWSS